MTRYVWHDGAWVAPRARNSSARVAIHSDFAEPLHCHADDRMHSSRSTYNEAVRAAGLVEIGRTEMKRLEAGPPVRATKLESPRATIRRLMEQ